MKAELSRLRKKRRRLGRLNKADMTRYWELKELLTCN